MNCPVCATDVSAGARACSRCGYQFPAEAAPEERSQWPGYASGSWPSLSGEAGSPPKAVSLPPEEPASMMPADTAPREERGFGYQTDSWPQVTAALPARREDIVVTPPVSPGDPGTYRHALARRSGLLVGVTVACVLIAGGLIWKVEFQGSAAPNAASTTTPTITVQVIPDTPTPETTPPDTSTPDTTPPDTPSLAPPPPDNAGEYSQLIGIESILTRSASSRTQLHSAMQQPCRNARTAEASLRQVIAQRQGQVGAARALDVSQVPDGGDLQADLVNLLTYSLQADRAYDQGYLAVVRYGCHAGDNYIQQGNDISLIQAQPAKQQFFSIWSPLAAEFGIEPVHSAGDV